MGGWLRSVMSESALAHRWLVLSVVAVLLTVLGACSGAGEADPVASPSTSAGPTTTAVDDAPQATSTLAPVTTEAPDARGPAGTWWEPGIAVTEPHTDLYPPRLTTAGGDLWLLTGRANGPLVFRSSDAGASWEPVDIADPPAEGWLVIEDVVAGPGGRLLASGVLRTSCSVTGSLDADGFRSERPIQCTQTGVALFVSDDGTTWNAVDSGTFDVPGDQQVRLRSTAGTNSEFLAVGTFQGVDWHSRVWSSPDGVDWTLERELRSENGAMGGFQIMATGDAVVVLTHEWPCLEARPTGLLYFPGWSYDRPTIRGLNGSWVRVYAGTDVAGLTPLTPADNPFALAPPSIDCESITNTELADLPRPVVRGATVGSSIALVQLSDGGEQTEVDDPLTDGFLLLNVLRDGSWESIRVDEVPVGDAVGFRGILDIDGVPGFVDWHVEDGLAEVRPVLPMDGGHRQVVPEISLIANRIDDAVWIDSTLVVVGVVAPNVFDSGLGTGGLLHVVVWRSSETTDPPPPCDLSSQGICVQSDLSLVEGYPDFSGRDLRGVDLSFSDLGEASFDDADLTGARLVGVEGGQASFVGATFTGADLSGALLGSSPDASFTDAILIDATLWDSSGADFSNADLQSAYLSFETVPVLTGARLEFANLSAEPAPDSDFLEISLAGIDLTGTGVRGPLRDEVVVRITDLSGAVIDGTRFQSVDLTGVAPTGIDLSGATFRSGAICPNGEPPDDSNLCGG